jgi:hypothetical protein
MTTHFHLVFETPRANCSKFMHSLSTAYTVYYNLRQGRHGHLLDGRYRAKLVEGDEYLLALSRYVHLNPVQTKSMKRKPLADRLKYLREYRWSSYPGFIGKQKSFEFVEYGPILGQMRGKRSQWAKRYGKYVETGLAEDDEEFEAVLKQSPRSIGGDAFRAWVDARYLKRMKGLKSKEDISFRHVTEPLSTESILEAVSEVLGEQAESFRERRRHSPLRAIAARMLIRFGDQTQREAAAQLNMGTGGAVSAQVRRLPAVLAADRQLRRSVTRIERRLEGLMAEAKDAQGKSR